VTKFYLTTPLYYVNDVPHIGHAYTTVAADALARWRRLRGDDVFFLTGTDEHGAKIAQAAEARGQTPQAYADHIAGTFRELWKTLSITQDDFIRTTEPRHVAVVRAVFARLKEKGDIYLGSYEDWYCTPCETFWSEAELADKKCPTCGREVERLKEDSYFFKLSAYEQPLLAHFEKHPEFLEPRSRAAEIVNFVRGGLKDLSVSRTKVRWGIPVPGEDRHTVYVWFDALLNYIAAPGYGTEDARWAALWPADVHLVGKEIFRFHAVIWPALLMALDLPLPRRVFAHGWWTVEGEKMSKSRGNVVDPATVAGEFGVDALRYYLLREVPFGGDGNYSREGLVGRYNAELANALGNLLNRTLHLLEKNFQGRAGKSAGGVVPPDTAGWIAGIDGAYEHLAFHEVLESVMALVNAGNKFIDEKAPWKTLKTDPAAAQACLTEVLRALKLAALALHPVMPSITQEIWKQLGETGSLQDSAMDILRSGRIEVSPDQIVKKGSPLFPKKEQ
jgi:methionyl-tRNA synthetase